MNDQLPFFSEPEIIPDAAQTQDASTATAEAEVSLAGTSAPLLTNPSLTDVPVSVPPLPDGISKLQDTFPVSGFPNIKDKVAEDVLEVAFLGGPEDTLPPLHGRLLVKLTHNHQLHRILILKRPLRSLHPTLTKALHRLTHTMTYVVIEYLGIAVEPAGSAIALAFWL